MGEWGRGGRERHGHHGDSLLSWTNGKLVYTLLLIVTATHYLHIQMGHVLQNCSPPMNILNHMLIVGFPKEIWKTTVPGLI